MEEVVQAAPEMQASPRPRLLPHSFRERARHRGRDAAAGPGEGTQATTPRQVFDDHAGEGAQQTAPQRGPRRDRLETRDGGLVETELAAQALVQLRVDALEGGEVHLLAGPCARDLEV